MSGRCVATRFGDFIGQISYKFYALFYVVSCFVGAALEFLYGAFWSKVGTSPWIYPDSPLKYTSLAVLPLWGFCGLVCVSLYRTLLHREVRYLRGAIVPLVLSALWILAYSWFVG